MQYLQSFILTYPLAANLAVLRLKFQSTTSPQHVI